MEWIGDDPDLLVESVVVEGDQVQMVVTGPPTDLDQQVLATDLASRLGRVVQLDLRHQLQDHTVLPGTATPSDE